MCGAWGRDVDQERRQKVFKMIGGERVRENI